MKKSRKSLSRSGKRRSRKSTNVTNNLLHNKMVLHLTMVLFVFNVLAFLFFKDMQSLFLLVIVLCITYLFDQNMIIVLLVPMLFVGILIVLRKGFMGNKLMEGMNEGQSGMDEGQSGMDEGQSGMDDDDEDDDDGDGDGEDKKKKRKKKKMKQSKYDKKKSSNDENNLMNNLTEKQPKDDKKKPEDQVEVKQSGFANINNEDTKNDLKKMVDDYDKMGKNFKAVVSESSLDPQSLEAQMKIVDQMNSITPIMKDVTKLLDKVDINGINKLVGSMGNIMGGNN